MMRGALFLAVGVACSIERAPTILFSDLEAGNAASACLNQGLNFHSRPGAEPSVDGCELAGVRGSSVGYGMITLLHRVDPPLSVCSMQVSSELTGPVALRSLIQPIEDPYARFVLEGMLPGIDSRREFERMVPFVGGRITIEQKQLSAGGASFYLVIDACRPNPNPGAANINTNGAPIRFPSPE